MSIKLPKWLTLPETRDVTSLDDPTVTSLHAQIIQKKPFLRRLYLDFYRQFEKALASVEGKVIVELGSGGGFIKQVIPNAITSDMLDLPTVDKVFAAENMPFEDADVDAFVMFDVFHHIADPRAFLVEAVRCLKVGGKIVMIEPANTPWGRFIYKNFHHENFAPDAEWKLKSSRPLSCANSALAWIVFRRDRKTFESQFPSLKIVSMQCHTPFRYLLSGGFTLRQLAPACAYTFVKTCEKLLSPFNSLLGMFVTIELQKTA